MSQEQWLIVGLGNPEPKYFGNRHNVGHMVVDALVKEMGGKLGAHKTPAWVCEGHLGIPGSNLAKVVVAKLSSYMNTSGHPTRALCDFFHIPPDHLLVIHDELDLPEHELRLKKGGGEGGHNGLRSISQHLGTKDYCRLRIGVGRPPGRMDPARYVLTDFPSSEKSHWEVTVAKAADAAAAVVAEGFTRAQMKLHTG